jgi:hypothetical protein
MKYLVFFILLFISFFLVSCQQHKPMIQLNTVQKYIDVWNGGNPDTLNSITTDNFQLRINPTFEAMNGRDKLKEEIAKTRFVFPDFAVKEQETVILGDTALAVTWVISGTYKNPQDTINYGKKAEASGFSIIYFNDGKLTGEWIAYSDLTWYKNFRK